MGNKHNKLVAFVQWSQKCYFCQQAQLCVQLLIETIQIISPK